MADLYTAAAQDHDLHDPGGGSVGISGEQGTGQQAVADTHNAAVFAGIAAVIFYMTVCARGEETAEAVLVPFQNFREAREQPELYRSMLMNVLLFFPIGLSLPFVLGKWKLSVPVTVVLACLSSAGIEYLQYRYSLGRCEVDDVIMNTLGALLGCSARWISHSRKRK